ncbi:MAG: hypothetical protein ABIN96_13110 [Rubrivivax sp.]
MTTRHRLWQARWELDALAGTAVHDSGLQVRLLDGAGVADNGDDIVQALTAAHGAHNATAMVQRLVREGAQLLIDPHARGWRGGSAGVDSR